MGFILRCLVCETACTPYLAGLGQNFKYLSKLRHKLIGNKILTEKASI